MHFAVSTYLKMELSAKIVYGTPSAKKKVGAGWEGGGGGCNTGYNENSWDLSLAIDDFMM